MTLDSVSDQGVCAIPVRRLLSVVEMATGEVSVSSKGGIVSVSCGNISAKISALDELEFPRDFSGPELYSANFASRLEVPDLSDLLLRLEPFMEAGGNRPILACVHLLAVGGKLVAEASNGGSLLRIDSGINAANGVSILIPSGAVSAIIGLFKGLPASVLVSENCAVISGDGVEFHFKLLDGRFPDVSHLIPISSFAELEVDSNMLYSAAGHIASAGCDQFGRCWFSYGPSGIELSARSESDSGAFSVSSTIASPQRTNGGEFVVNALNLKNAAESLRSNVLKFECIELQNFAIRSSDAVAVFSKIKTI